MGQVVAIDAGTTGVRALVVDERARVADVAYREITQYFPRPGWVEHDAAEIWDAVRATLAEVGGRLADAGDTVAAIGITNQRETLVAFDRATGRPLHRAIVWQDRRTADSAPSSSATGHLPFGAGDAPGWCSTRTSRATKMTYLLRHGDLALRADSPDLAFGTVDSWLLWNLTGGTEGGEFATDASNASRTMLLDIRHPHLVRRALRPLRRAPAHRCPTSAPRPAASAGRAGRPRPAGSPLDGVPVAGVLGDQQAALFGQSCFDPGMVKVTYGTGSFVLANAGARAPAAARRASPSAWPGTSARTPAARGHRWPTPSRAPPSSPAPPSSGCATGSASSTSAAEIGPLAASVADSGGVTFVPASPGSAAPGGTPPPAASSPASPGAPAGPRWPGPAWRPWPSRCAT